MCVRVHVHELHIQALTCTCELLLCLYRVRISEQSHCLLDAAAALDLVLVLEVLEGQVAEGGRGRLADVRTGAAQETHQGGDPVQL